jgi:3-hydroxyacyl-CoA dehydrogenase
MKKRYTEEQIIRAIKQHEAGAKVDDICRDMGISQGTFYNWRCANVDTCTCFVSGSYRDLLENTKPTPKLTKPHH